MTPETPSPEARDKPEERKPMRYPRCACDDGPRNKKCECPCHDAEPQTFGYSLEGKWSGIPAVGPDTPYTRDTPMEPTSDTVRMDYLEINRITPDWSNIPRGQFRATVDAWIARRRQGRIPHDR